MVVTLNTHTHKVNNLIRYHGKFRENQIEIIHKIVTTGLQRAPRELRIPLKLREKR